MAVLKMGELFYPDRVEILKNDQVNTKYNRVIHADLLKHEANNNLGYNFDDQDIDIYYLIQIFLENNIPFVQEVNDMKPKYYVIYLPNDLSNLTKLQVDMLIDKLKKMKSFKKRGNKLAIASFDNYQEFKNGNYILYSLEDVISKLYRIKYANVMDIGRSR